MSIEQTPLRQAAVQDDIDPDAELRRFNQSSPPPRRRSASKSFAVTGALALVLVAMLVGAGFGLHRYLTVPIPKGIDQSDINSVKESIMSNYSTSYDGHGSPAAAYRKQRMAMRDTLQANTEEVYRNLMHQSRFETETEIMVCDYLVATKWVPPGWELLEDPEINAAFLALKKEMIDSTDYLGASTAELNARDHFREVWKRHGGKKDECPY